jgi:sirohydrochlorin cobaltochelatase
MTISAEDKRAPMAAAPIKYAADGSVDWGNMWDSFCVLAREGGPPHRSQMLGAQEDADALSDGYRFAVNEICRGIFEVSGLRAEADRPGWIGVRCHSAGMARWLAESIEQENVQARAEGTLLYVPAGDSYTLKGEIKNVITAVAKTTHYWGEHLPPDAKRALALQTRLADLTARMAGWLGKRDERLEI